MTRLLSLCGSRRLLRFPEQLLVGSLAIDQEKFLEVFTHNLEFKILRLPTIPTITPLPNLKHLF